MEYRMKKNEMNTKIMAAILVGLMLVTSVGAALIYIFNA